MAGSKYLLDTNIIAAILNKEPEIEAKIADKEVYLCSIALGELYYGAFKSTHVEENRRRIELLATRYPLLLCDQGTAQQYGEIKFALRKKGRPIPENDIWIAAIGLQHGLTLLSRDDHFTEVENLVIENW